MGNKTHGKKYTSIYKRWDSMKQRCYNPKSDGYKNYGGRGIEVCDRWRYSFENFYADMGDPPPNTSLDRRDNDGNYEPSNCRWATPTEQNQNSRTAVLITINGVTKAMAQWARDNGIPYGICRSRYRTGWSGEDAVSIPVGARRRRQSGEVNSVSKLTNTQVLEIRRRRDAKETVDRIALDFPVSRSTIHAIGARKLWQDLPEE